MESKNDENVTAEPIADINIEEEVSNNMELFERGSELVNNFEALAARYPRENATTIHNALSLGSDIEEAIPEILTAEEPQLNNEQPNNGNNESISLNGALVVDTADVVEILIGPDNNEAGNVEVKQEPSANNVDESNDRRIYIPSDLFTTCQPSTSREGSSSSPKKTRIEKRKDVNGSVVPNCDNDDDMLQEEGPIPPNRSGENDAGLTLHPEEQGSNQVPLNTEDNGSELSSSSEFEGPKLYWSWESLMNPVCVKQEPLDELNQPGTSGTSNLSPKRERPGIQWDRASAFQYRYRFLKQAERHVRRLMASLAGASANVHVKQEPQDDGSSASASNVSNVPVKQEALEEVKTPSVTDGPSAGDTVSQTRRCPPPPRKLIPAPTYYHYWTRSGASFSGLVPIFDSRSSERVLYIPSRFCYKAKVSEGSQTNEKRPVAVPVSPKCPSQPQIYLYSLKVGGWFKEEDDDENEDVGSDFKLP